MFLPVEDRRRAKFDNIEPALALDRYKKGCNFYGHGTSHAKSNSTRMANEVVRSPKIFMRAHRMKSKKTPPNSDVKLDHLVLVARALNAE